MTLRWLPLRSLSVALRTSLLRYPLPCFFALFVTGLLVYLADDDFRESEHLMRYAFLGGLGFLFSLLLDLIAEVRTLPPVRRTLLHGAGLALLAAYGIWVLPASLEDARSPFWYSYFILLFALHLAVALIPALRKGANLRLWSFNLNCFLRFFFSSVNAALLFGGLALALLSVDKLFEIGVDDSAYLQLWLICAFLVHPLLFLGGLASPLNDPPEDVFPKPLRFTLCFIGLPVIALYLLILYAYVAKIGLQWSWPNGWVAMPIFILAVISLLTFALSLPLPKTTPWARHFHRFLFPALLPLSIVLFLALQVRLSDYGMTINRYLGLALALWLFGLSVAYLVRPRLAILWMPLSLLFVTLFAIGAGPLSAFGWSQRSQVARLNALAAELGIAQSGPWAPTTQANEPTRSQEFNSSLRYVLENFGHAPLEAELTGFFEAYPKLRADLTHRHRNQSAKIINWLGLSDDQLPSRYYSSRKTVYPAGGHEWMLELQFYNGRGQREATQHRSFDLSGNTLNFEANFELGTLQISEGDKAIVSISLSDWAATLRSAVEAGPEIDLAPITFSAEGNGWSFNFVMRHGQLTTGLDAFESMGMWVFLSAPPAPAAP